MLPLPGREINVATSTRGAQRRSLMAGARVAGDGAGEAKAVAEATGNALLRQVNLTRGLRKKKPKWNADTTNEARVG